MSHFVHSLKQLVAKPAWSDLGYLVAFDAEPRIYSPREPWASETAVDQGAEQRRERIGF